MMNGEENDITFIQGEPIEKDWGWWSSFLQRNYYGAPEEMATWNDAARSIAKEVGLTPGTSVLDLGSGCGEMVLQLSLLGGAVTGVERSEPLVESCRSLAAERGIAAEFIAADMFAFTPTRSYDLILSLNTSFGYGDDLQNRELIRKIGSWLNPGGAFYCDLISADQAEAFGCWNDTVAGGQFIVDNSYDPKEQIMTSHPTWIAPDNKTIYVADSPEVVRLYDRSTMEEMMRTAGMEPHRLARAMGRRFRQTDDQMLSTWVARRTEA